MITSHNSTYTISSTLIKKSEHKVNLNSLEQHQFTNKIDHSIDIVSNRNIGSTIWSINRQNQARPGYARRLIPKTHTNNVSSSRTIEDRLKTHKEDNNKQMQILQKSLSIDENDQLDNECLQRFVKFNARLMTKDRVSFLSVFFFF